MKVRNKDKRLYWKLLDAVLNINPMALFSFPCGNNELFNKHFERLKYFRRNNICDERLDILPIKFTKNECVISHKWQIDKLNELSFENLYINPLISNYEISLIKPRLYKYLLIPCMVHLQFRKLIEKSLKYTEENKGYLSSSFQFRRFQNYVMTVIAMIIKFPYRKFRKHFKRIFDVNLMKENSEHFSLLSRYFFELDNDFYLYIEKSIKKKDKKVFEIFSYIMPEKVANIIDISKIEGTWMEEIIKTLPENNYLRYFLKREVNENDESSSDNE